MNRRLLLCFVLFCSFQTVFCQKQDVTISLNTGALSVAPNLSDATIARLNQKRKKDGGLVMVLLQFQDIPAEAIKNQLQSKGVFLLHYVPRNTYAALLQQDVRAADLQRSGVRAIVEPTPQQKIHPLLLQMAANKTAAMEVWVRCPRLFRTEEILAVLQQHGFRGASLIEAGQNVLSLQIKAGRLLQLAALPYIEYVEAAPPPPQPLLLNSRAGARANRLQAGSAFDGMGLTGEGVVIGIGDNGSVQTHADLTGYLISQTLALPAAHALATHGIAGGAGIIDERFKGFAPKATMLSEYFAGILSNTPLYVKDYGMVITSNSYGNVGSCALNGLYDMSAGFVDQQLLQYPHLQHVFAAGNSGRNTCPPFAAGFGTVLGSYQSAKNVLTVGSTTSAGVIAHSSSRGPVRDGRIKPEVTAVGEGVRTTGFNNGYATHYGTSIAAPAVAGGLALLYQRYRQLHNNANPPNYLMKALVCNGATDLGNKGPDYLYGFGWLNLLRSVDMLNNNRYILSSVAHNTAHTHQIVVPPNTAQVKMMLYWNDPLPSPLSSQALVNNLDMRLETPAAATVLPLVLDTAAARVHLPATTGADHSNNIEQIVLDDPAAGAYTVHISGTTVAEGPAQEYVLVYDFIPQQLQLTYPSAGELLTPGGSEQVQWESEGYSSGSYNLFFSADSGATWSSLAAGIPAGSRMQTVSIPNVATRKALMKLVHSETGVESVSGPFVVLGAPAVSLEAVQCEGYINLKWGSIAGATGYEVLLLRGNEMVPVAHTTALRYSLSGLSKDSTYIVSVRARKEGMPGRRSVALVRKPDSGTCAGAVSDNDLKIDAVLSPRTGRKYTRTGLSAATTVTVRIKNLDDAATHNFTVQYSVDGGQHWVSEPVTTTIAAGATYTHTFRTTVDFSAVGSYPFVAVVKNSAADLSQKNDTAFVLVRHLANEVLHLETPFTEDFETAGVQVLTADSIGINGLERFDFEKRSPYGRLRTFVHTGMACSGSRALTLDVDRQTSNKNYLTATFNLSNYRAAEDEVRLDFRYKLHGITNTENRLWIRGHDTLPWIEIYQLQPLAEGSSPYQQAASLELSDALVKNGQDFSAAFQVRWEQDGIYPALDQNRGGGYSLDDLRLYTVLQDVQLLRIDSLGYTRCGLSSEEPLGVWVRNGTGREAVNVPIRYSINGGAWVEEVIPVLGGNDSLHYFFRQKPNLSAPIAYTINIAVNLAADEARENDSLHTRVHNISQVTVFPYLQHFEQGAGGWFADGRNSSWALCTPASGKINRAASGSKAWKTGVTGNSYDFEESYLYSPCLQIAGMKKPTLSFLVALDLADCNTVLCNGAWVEYSEDGVAWKRLNSSESTNWYNKGDTAWSVEGYTRWHVATVALPEGINTVRLRFVFRSFPAIPYEGMAVDDVHVYDNSNGIYTGASLSAPVVQNLSGTEWIHIEKDSRLLASVQPHNQNLGNTQVGVWLHSDSVRHTNRQYYHNRNWAIIPANKDPNDSVRVRLYVTDSETEALIKAAGCTGCTGPQSVLDLGITKYTDRDAANENNTLADNKTGLWSFIEADRIRIVPFDAGYYAEFSVNNFSEFWLNAGGLQRDQVLPVKFISIRAEQKGTREVEVSWKVAAENNVVRYEVEVARSTAELEQGRFERIGAVPARGTGSDYQLYSFIDGEQPKYGIRYYRIKVVDADGDAVYSNTQAVRFAALTNWLLFPNPSPGKFYLVYQMGQGETATLQLTDMLGRKLKVFTLNGNAVAEKLTIDLSGGQYAPGMYFLQVQQEQETKVFRLYKQ